jgi:hypothetical protein
VGEEHRLDQRRRPVIERGVGHLHPGELTDQGLELEDDLQGALRDFGLVGGVGGEELGPRQDGIDHARIDVAIDPGPQKRRNALGGEIGQRHGLKLRPDRVLIAAVVHGQPVDADVGRNRRKELIDGLESELGEYSSTILVAGTDPRVHQALSASIMAV